MSAVLQEAPAEGAALPSGWSVRPLRDIADIERAGVRPDDIRAGTLFVGLEHIEAGGRILGVEKVEPGDIASTKFRFDEGHVLYGKLRPYLSKIALPDFAGICSTDILPIRPGPDLDRKYFAQFLRQPELVRYAASRASGANLPRLSPMVLGTFPIPLPPLAEQRRIAGILDAADALRAKRRESIALLDTMTQSIFRDMFGEGGSSRCMPFGQACKRLTVGVVVKPASYYVEDGVPALRTLNVKPGYLDLSDLVRFSPVSNDGPLSKSKLMAGDLVIARTGRPGTTAVVPVELDGANAIDLLIATPDPEVALPTYLEVLMNSEVMNRLVLGQQRGQIQKHFNVGSLREAPIPIPSLGEQSLFARRITQLRSLRTRAIRNLAELDGLFHSVQSRAFRGEL